MFKIEKGKELNDGTNEYLGTIKDTGKCYRFNVYGFYENKDEKVLAVMEYQRYVNKNDIDFSDAKKKLENKVESVMKSDNWTKTLGDDQ